MGNWSQIVCVKKFLQVQNTVCLGVIIAPSGEGGREGQSRQGEMDSDLSLVSREREREGHT